MPPRARRANAAADLSNTLVLGIIGIGDIGEDEGDDREIRAILDDLLGADGVSKAEIIFAATGEGMGDGGWKAWQYIEKNLNADLAIAAVIKEKGDADDEALLGSAEDAKARQVKVAGDDLSAIVVVDELAKARAAGADARLLVFLVTDEDPDVDSGGQYAAIEAAVQAGIKAFDITNAMDVIDIGTPEPEQAPEPPPADPPKRGRGRPSAASKAAEAAARTTTAEPAEEERPPTRTRGREKATAGIEAQDTASAAVAGNDAAVGSILDLFAEMVARKVAELLK